MKVFKLGLSLCLLYIMSSCLKEDNETLVLPKVKYAKPIDQVIPVDMQNNLKQYMSINIGSTPPDIKGIYLINPHILVFSSDGDFEPGYTFIDETIKFSNQNDVTNLLTYEDKTSSSTSSSDDVSISGTNNNFTAYFNTIGVTDGISTKEATVISGTKTSAGIKDLSWAFVMLEKGADPNHHLVEVGTYRVFKDGDGEASNTTWDAEKSAVVEKLGFTVLQNANSNHINP